MFTLCSIYHGGEVLRLSSVDYAAIGLIQVPQGSFVARNDHADQ